MGWLKVLFRKKERERELDSELRFHLGEQTRANIASGMNSEEARREASIEFGGLDQVKEECRDVRSGVWLGHLAQDLRYGLRMLLKSPIFSFVAVLSLTLGIGAATAIFSLVNAVLLGSLPVPNPQELRVLTWAGTEIHMIYWGVSDLPNHITGEDFSYAALLALRKQCVGQAEIFGFVPTYEGVLARARHETISARGLMVSGNFFAALGVRPLLGTLLSDQDDRPGAAPKAVISYRWWEQQFEHDPGVLGQQVVLNGHSFTVVGVLPPRFTGVRTGSNVADLYFPISVQPQLVPANWPVNAPDHWWVELMARLRPGVSEAQFRAVLDVAFRNDAEKFLTNPRALISDGRDGPDENRVEYQRVLLPLLGVVGVVLVVTSANLAGLLLARGAARQHELSIRIAVGASGWRLIRQLLTEGLLLSFIGGGCGLLLAVWGRTAISRILAGSAEGLRYDTAMDLKVLGFALVATLLTGLLSGVYPALRAGARDPVVGLKDRGIVGASRIRAGHFLVVVQICLALVLMIGAGLYVRALINLLRINPGFVVENILLFRVNPGNAGFNPSQNNAYYARVQDGLLAIPGVVSASLIPFPLLDNIDNFETFTIPGHSSKSGANTIAHVLSVGEGYFNTMDIPILSGRTFRTADSHDAPKVIVVNETFARENFPGQIPVGQTVRFWDTDDWQVVGVCRDTKYISLKEAPPAAVYFSFHQYTRSSAFFAVRTRLSPLSLAAAVRKAVAAVDPNIPLDDLSTQEEIRDRTIGSERTIVALCGSLAAVTILLSCMGLYGLMSFDVARRTGEVGIRIALGATRWQIFEPILRGALVLAGAGIAIGVPLALALTHAFCTNLYGLTPTDPLTYCGASILMLAVALVAASVPANRAAKVDPMVALRCE